MVETAKPLVQTPDDTQSTFTKHELEQLNKAELALLSSRCALRVMPLVGITGTLPGWLKDRIRHMRAVESSASASRTVLFNEAKNAAADARIAAAASSSAAAVAARASRSPHVVTVSYAACAAGAVAATGNLAAAIACSSAALMATQLAFPQAESTVIAAMRADYAWLLKTRGQHEDMERGLDTFFKRTLWDGAREPEGWRTEVFDRWCVPLVEVTLEPMFERYEKITKGAYRRVDAATAVNDWYWRHRSRDKPPSLEELKASLVQAMNELHEILVHGFEIEEEEAPETPIPQPPGVPVMVADSPAAVDRLGRRPLAVALAAMLAAPTQRAPFTAALIGERGSGRTSFLQQIRVIIESESNPFSAEASVVWVDATNFEKPGRVAADLTSAVGAALTGGGAGKTNRVSGLSSWWLISRYLHKQRGLRFLREVFALGAGVAAVVAPIAMYAYTGDLSQIISSVGAWLSDTTWFDRLAIVFTMFVVGLWLRVGVVRLFPPFSRLPRGKQLGPHSDELQNRLATLYGLRLKERQLVVFIDGVETLGSEAAERLVAAAARVLDIPRVMTIVALTPEQANGGSTTGQSLLPAIDLAVGMPCPSSSDQADYVTTQLMPTGAKGFVDSVEPPPRERLDEDLESLLGPGQSAREVGGDESERDFNPSDIRNVSHADEGDAGDDDGGGYAERYCDQDELKLRGDIAMSENESELFDRIARVFEVTNPQRLLQLANAYRLFKATQLLQSEPERPTPLDLGLAMRALLWLERLSACDATTRTAAVAWLWGHEAPGAVADPGLLALLRQRARFTALMRAPFGVSIGDGASNTREQYFEVATTVADICFPQVRWSSQSEAAAAAWHANFTAERAGEGDFRHDRANRYAHGPVAPA